MAMTLSAGVPPPGCYKTFGRYDLIVKLVQFVFNLIDNIKCIYKKYKK